MVERALEAVSDPASGHAGDLGPDRPGSLALSYLETILEGKPLQSNDLDLAAAAVYLAYDVACGKAETMPEAVKQRLLRPDMP